MMDERRNRRNLNSLLGLTGGVELTANNNNNNNPDKAVPPEAEQPKPASNEDGASTALLSSKARRVRTTNRLRRTLGLTSSVKKVGEALAEQATTQAATESVLEPSVEPAPSANVTYQEYKAQFDLLDPKRYLGADGHMRIDRDDWRELQSRYTGEQNRGRLVALLDDIVTVNKIGPPMRMITRDDAIGEFRALQALDTSTLFEAARTQSRYNYQSTLGLLYLMPDNTGNLTSDYLYQDIRWMCRGGRVDSPIESWEDPKARRAIFHHLLDSDAPFVDRHRLRKHLGTRRYIPTPYRPATAKALFDFIQPKSVLDLSVGWGDRLVGFEASLYPLTYYGIDPDRRVLEQGRKLHRMCRQTRKKVELYQSPAEDFRYEVIEEPVDMLYFAPPPFNTERYSQDADQAHVRYKDEQSFIDDFLLKTITKAWSVLKRGGTLALDLGDLRGPQYMGGRHHLVDPLITAILRDIPNSTFRGTIGAAVGKHKPSSDFDSVRVDPIWIITKGHSAVARRVLFGSKHAEQINAQQMNPEH